MSNCVFKTDWKCLWLCDNAAFSARLWCVWHNLHHIPVCSSFVSSRGMLCLILFPRFSLRQAFLRRGWDGKVSTWSSEWLQHRWSHCCVIRFQNTFWVSGVWPIKVSSRAGELHQLNAHYYWLTLKNEEMESNCFWILYPSRMYTCWSVKTPQGFIFLVLGIPLCSPP